jgi:hypothetical protein
MERTCRKGRAFSLSPTNDDDMTKWDVSKKIARGSGRHLSFSRHNFLFGSVFASVVERRVLEYE